MGHGARRTSRSAGGASPTRRPPRSSARPTARSPSCATAARRATTGWPPGCASFAVQRRQLRLELRAGALGAAAAARRAPSRACRRCASCASADGRWLAGRRAAWLATWAGRWALGAAARSRSTRTRPTRWPASCRRSGRSTPERLTRRGAACALPTGIVMLVGQAWLRRGRDGHPRRRARRVRLVAGRRRPSGPTDADEPLRRTRRCSRVAPRARRDASRSPSAAWRSASFTHSAVYLALLLCAFVLGNPQPETFILGLAHGVIWIAMSLRLHRRRPRADHPVLAGGDGRRARRPGAVRRVDRLRGRRAPAAGRRRPQ